MIKNSNKIINLTKNLKTLNKTSYKCFSTGSSVSTNNIYNQIKKIDEFVNKKPSVTRVISSGAQVNFNENKIGAQATANIYSKNVKIGEKKQIVLVKIGGGVIESDLSSLINSLNFLRKIGLFPIVVHGGGPQLNAELEAAGETAEYVEGLRVTPPSVLAIAQRVFLRENLKIVEALESSGTKARPITQGVYQATPLDPQLYGFVGNVTKIHTNALASCITNDYVPVISSLAMTPEGQVLNINADVAALELAKSINPLKILFINTTAGMKDGDGKVMQHIRLDEQYDGLMKQPWVKHGTKLKLKEFKSCLDVLPPSTSITITSPDLLMKELFSKKGSGTTVERGEVMLSSESSSFEESKFFALVEKSSTHKNRIDFQQLKNDISKGSIKVYVNNYYTAGLIVRKVKNYNFVDQFLFFNSAVQSTEDSESIFKKLFATDKFVWKQSPSEESDLVTDWFKKVAQGYSFNAKTNEKIYWTNIETNEIESVLNEVSNQSSNTYLNSISKGGASASDKVLPDKSRKYRVGLIGARGFTGGNLVRLIDNHKQLELAVASSSTNFGKPVTTEFPSLKSDLKFENVKPENVDIFTRDHGIDGWFLALPDKISAPYVETLEKSNERPVLVDLSSDHRFDDKWTYGQPETNRAIIKESKLIANPGCYATGMFLTLKPFIGDLVSPPSCFGISGYSGAGSKPSDKNDLNRLSNNILPYKLVNHTHELEVGHQLGSPIFFMPHVGQFFQGITLTISMELKYPLTKEQVIQRYQKYYHNEPLIKIDKDGIPEVKANSGKHTVTIGGFAVNGNHLVVVTTLDNLLKGAATQALQNLNLTLGLPELSSIEDEL
ncbi:acetylglutamate kinase [Dictyostelium purpureum]|uniref:Acetylglutamate kinase n=1 Tax=Dictyostelium purpureum TaxID=5786 RepID=F0ZHV7_DICPU|nr:acetylglutamate kinase [Dictyostelium purpureum]EGC36489.1 acetylglutamate kinase [Dictyostelium purpureum]|eukprot:XP_003287002.1 acetylglutamate kinase [Dictyostelium purpureum]